MSVAITDPPDNSDFPDQPGDPWTATATISNDDAVDGVLLDYTTDDMYPSPGPSPSGGPDSNGLYTWQVPFSPDGVTAGDFLLIYCYDAELNGNGATCAETACEDGGAYSKPERRAMRHPREDAPSIHITDAKLSSGTVTVKATLTPPQTKGCIFLVLANPAEGPEFTRLIRHCLLSPDASTARSCTFSSVDDGNYTHIHVIGVTYRNQGTLDKKAFRIKPPV
jgi:hypothetical protein